MTRRRIVIALAAVGVALVAYSAYDLHRAAAIWPDEMPALEMPPPAIPAHPDALARFDALIDAAADLETDETRAALLAAEGPPAEPPGGWPADRPDVQAALDAFLATGGLVLEPVQLDAEPTRPLLPLVQIAALRNARALRRFAEGDPEAAWRDAVDSLRFAQRLQHAGGHLLAAMIGLSLEGPAHETARRLLDAGGFTPGAGAYAAEIDAAETRPNPLVAALTGECLSADALYARIGEADVESMSAPGGPGRIAPAAEGATRADDSWLYDSRATRALARQQCRALLDAVATPAPARALPEPPDLGARGWWSVGPMLDNPIGRTLLAIAQPTFGRFADRADRVVYTRRRARLAFARAAYTAAEGQAPTAVDALVPRFLPVAPIDPLTGRPMPLDPPPPPDEPG